MLKNLKNSLVKYVAIPTIALGIGTGCRDASQDFYKFKEKDDLTMGAWSDAMGNHFRIDGDEYNSYLKASDNYMFSDADTLDGRFDEIKLVNIPKGHPIEKYANLDSINVLYQEVKETGEDVK